LDYKKSAMRKWQQDLVSDPGTETSQQFSAASQEIKTRGDSEIPSAQEKSKENALTFEFTETHVAILIFFLSFFILCALKPAIILRKVKERPEESLRINYFSVFLLSVFTSAIYLGLCNKVFQ
jgi:hypothetical protein